MTKHVKHQLHISKHLKVSNHPMHSGGYSSHFGLGLAPTNGFNNLGESPTQEAQEESNETNETSEPGEARE